MAEFSYHNTKHSGPEFSPFNVVSGTEPLSPIDLALHGTSVKDGDEGEVIETKLFLEESKRILELSKEALQRTQKCYEKQVNKNPKVVEFQGRAEGMVECEEFHIAVGPNAQVHG